MSNDIIMADTVKPKREKRDKKQKKAAGDADAEVQPAAPVEAAAAEPSDKKDKKKKRKLEAEGEAVPTEGEASGPTEEKPAKKKKKKDKSAKTPALTEESATPASTEVVTPATATPKDGAEAAPALSKKQLKKLAKAAKASAAGDSSAAASSSGPGSTPPAQLTPTSPEFLAASASSSATTAFLAEQGITLTPPTFPAFLDLSSLPINPALRPYLSAFSKPTPIQSCSWPPLFVGRDVVGIAETGSGKTLSFGLPGLHRLSASLKLDGGKPTGGKGQILLLVLAPTRELALQTHETLQALGKLVGINAACLFGGVNKGEQVREIKKKETRIVVGTPGRILDLAQSNEVDFSGVNYLVLDEADRMLDQGFENDIRRIIALCPSKDDGRQTVMFSATWPESVRRLASTFLTDSVKITVGSDELSANKRIEQIVEVLDDGRAKDPRLLHHLRTHLKANPPTAGKPTRILVFALYKKEASRLEGTIRRAGYTVAGLHGDLDQNARFRALDAFKEGNVQVLVATDVAARGLDIPDVNLVINVTFPLTTEDFVHRCGRTGRAGKTGKAVTFFTGENHERSLAGEFMRVLRDVGAEIPSEMDRFPSTIKKKEHGAYGAFYKDTTNAPAPKKIVFD